MLAGSERRVGFMGLNSWLKTVLKKLLEGFRKQPSQSSSQSGVGGSPSTKRYTDLTRFIFYKGHFSTKERAKPKPGAFLPSSDLKTSALGKEGLTGDKVWAIGVLVGKGRGKLPKARADFVAGDVTDAKLTIEPDPIDDIPDHVNLCGWPKEKDEQKSIAQLLCAHARLVLPAEQIQ
jgi:hypothetical protein